MVIKVKEQKNVFRPYTIEIAVDTIEQHESLEAMVSYSHLTTMPAEAAEFYRVFAKHTSEKEIERHLKVFFNSLRTHFPKGEGQIKPTKT